MAFFSFHILFIFGSLCKLLVPPGGPDPFEIRESSLLFKKYMLKPNSWIHFLFLKKNRYTNLFHIKQNAIIVISFWIYFLINSIICSFILYFDIVKVSCLALKISAGIIMDVYLLITIIVNCVLSTQSHELEERQLKMKPKESADLIKEIESLVPHFYDEPRKIKKINRRSSITFLIESSAFSI